MKDISFDEWKNITRVAREIQDDAALTSLKILRTLRASGFTDEKTSLICVREMERCTFQCAVYSKIIELIEEGAI